MQAITHSPCPSAATVRRATVSSVSPKYCRRSEWPTIAPRTPSSSSIGAETSPVKAPSSAQCTFWAKIVWPRSTAAGSETYGGQSTASTPSGASNASQNSRGAAARRCPRDAVEQAELVQRADRVRAADNREGVCASDRFGHCLGAPGEGRPLEDAHRAVPENRLRRRDRRREALLRLGADVEPQPAIGQLVVRRHLGLGVLGELGRGDDIDWQLDLEA